MLLTFIALVNSPILIFFSSSKTFLERLSSSTHPILPPYLAVSLILKILAVFLKPSLFILRLILLILFSTVVFLSILKKISDKKYCFLNFFSNLLIFIFSFSSSIFTCLLNLSNIRRFQKNSVFSFSFISEVE